MQVTVAIPFLSSVREEVCVLLRLDLGRVSQAISPVPTKLLLLLRLVLLVMRRREGTLLQWKGRREDELCRRVSMEQPGRL